MFANLDQQKKNMKVQVSKFSLEQKNQYPPE